MDCPGQGHSLYSNSTNSTVVCTDDDILAGNTNCTNVTDANSSGLAFPLPVFTFSTKVRVSLTFILMFISLVGNLIVFVTMFRNRARKSRVNFLIMHLAVADIVMTLIVMPLDGVWNLTIQWYGGEAACRILMFLKMWALYASTFILVVISIDRCTAILRPLSMTDAYKRCKIMVMLVWVIGGILSIPQLSIFHLVTPAPTFTQCATHGVYNAPWQEPLYNSFHFVMVFILPLAIMITCYLLILAEISRKHRELTDPLVREEGHRLRHSGADRMAKAKEKTWLMTFVIVSAFVINWSPYYVLMIWFLVDRCIVFTVPSAVSDALFIFGLTNPCLDPLIYGLFSINFVREFRRCCGWLKRKDFVTRDSTFGGTTVVSRVDTVAIPLRSVKTTRNGTSTT
uniref:Gonadotropin-releasing hormone receptor 2 isoform 1 n=1 Tax=Branchiostoma floridae TaxID=7739 RepID=C0IP20_BRAFL|nr:gonadotropin-releasing hormone receptor 2 isoform 1 [Branchiostoma floridae]